MCLWLVQCWIDIWTWNIWIVVVDDGCGGGGSGHASAMMTKVFCRPIFHPFFEAYAWNPIRMPITIIEIYTYISEVEIIISSNALVCVLYSCELVVCLLLCNGFDVRKRVIASSCFILSRPYQIYLMFFSHCRWRSYTLLLTISFKAENKLLEQESRKNNIIIRHIVYTFTYAHESFSLLSAVG